MFFLRRSYIVVALVAIMAFIGWLTDVEVLKSVLPGLQTMKILTAVCFLASAASIYFRGFSALVISPVVFLVGAIQLAELTIGTEILPVNDPLLLRMSEATATMFVAFSILMILYHWKSVFPILKVAEIVCVASLFICLLALLGLFLDYRTFYGIDFFSTLALHTSICFALLFWDVLRRLARNPRSWFHLIYSRNLGGRVVLRRWAFTIFVPIILSGVILVGVKYNFYEIEFAYFLMVASSSAFATYFLLRKAKIIEGIDLENQALLLEKQKINDDLKVLNAALEKSRGELEQKNGELVKAVDVLYRRNRELDQFTYHTSHDIRSPVATILGITTVALNETSLEKLIEYLHVIEDRGKRLDRFISQMIAFTHNERTSLVLEPVEVSQLLSSCIEDLRGYPGADSLRVDVEVDTDNPVFVSDHMRLRDIFINLLENAIKFKNPFSEQSFLKIAITSTSEYLRIQFEDNGIGIDDDYLPKIFDMFQRGTDRVEGSGLGLYIVEQTVKKLDGDIRLSSVLGEGTSIEMDLPIRKTKYLGQN